MAFRATSGTTIAETTFANIPSPVGSNGLIIRVSDVGPAPGILLISNNVIWRPLNGSAVLAQRTTNPVTRQSLSAGTLETIGTFPGGLVRAGMRLRLEFDLGAGAIGTGARNSYWQLGAAGNPDQFVRNAATVINSINTVQRVVSTLDVLADASAVHRGGILIYAAAAYNEPNGRATPTLDFSQPWETRISASSCAETAINITGATWAAGVATYTATAHTLATGDKTTVAGITPSGYNVVGVATVLDANTFTIPVAGDPGAYSSGGTSSRISNMISQSYSLSLIG